MVVASLLGRVRWNLEDLEHSANAASTRTLRNLSFIFLLDPPKHKIQRTFKSTATIPINMLRTVASSLSRAAKFAPVARATPSIQIAKFGTSEKNGSIVDAWNKSCYHEMDYTINENSTVFDAVEKFAAFDVGALVTVDDEGKLFVLHMVCS